jgi:hypothetical protein
VIDHLVLHFSFEINETRVHINNENELKIAVMYQNLLATVCSSQLHHYRTGVGLGGRGLMSNMKVNKSPGSRYWLIYLFIYGLVNVSTSSPDNKQKMNSQVLEMDLSCPNLMYRTSIYLERLRKYAKYFTHDRQYSARVLNLGHPT